MRHPSLERTSPKGGEFIGRCPSCGKENLKLNNISDDCESPMSQEDALIYAIIGEKK